MRESGMGGRVPGWKEREGAGNVLPILYQDEGEHHLFLGNYQQPPCEAPPNTAVNGGGEKVDRAVMADALPVLELVVSALLSGVRSRAV